MEIRIRQDNTEQALEALDDALERALTVVGGKIQRYAAYLCPVDTGLLRNSITFALDGEPPQISTYHAEYGSNRNSSGNRVRATAESAGSVKFGTYSGTLPQAGSGRRSVAVGSNVEYAVKIENGGSQGAPQGFLGPAVSNHLSEYERDIEIELRAN